MGIFGAALATIISRMVSTFLYVRYLLKGKGCLHVSYRYFKPSVQLYYEIIKVGLPILIFQFLSSTSVSITNIVAKEYGENVIAAMGIVNRIVALEAMVVFGFLKGYQPFVGYNYGALQMQRVKQATKTVILWSTIFCVLFGILCILFSRQLIWVFNKDSKEVMKIGVEAIIITAISYMGLGFQIVYGSYFLAIGKAKEGGILSLCRQGVFFIPIICILPHIFGLNGLLVAQLVADVLSTTLTVIFVSKEKITVNYHS